MVRTGGAGSSTSFGGLSSGNRHSIILVFAQPQLETAFEYERHYALHGR